MEAASEISTGLRGWISAPGPLVVGCWLAEQLQDLAEFFADHFQHRAGIAEQGWLRTGGLRVPRLGDHLARPGVEKFARALNGVALVVEQALDFEHQFHVLATIQAVSLAGFLGPERGELRLPEAQNIRLNSSKAADFADAKVQLVRNFRPMFPDRMLWHTSVILSNIEQASTFFYTGNYETAPEHRSKQIVANGVVAGIHPVREALRAGRTLDRVLIARGAAGVRLQEIIDLARERSVPLRFEPREALDRASNGAVHQGVVAFGAARGYAELDQAIAGAQLLIVLDGVEDPHNLGAIIRTAQAAGAGAVIVTERRAVGLTETVAKASAGALEHLPVVRVGNLAQTLQDLKKRGYWIYGLDERGAQLYSEIDYARPTVFVLGGEGHGLHELVKKHCDVLVRIPMAGAIASLNVSVATGVVLFEWRRRHASV